MTFRDMYLNEAIKKKNIKVKTYGQDDVDIKELHIYLASDDLIYIDHDKDSETKIKNWGADYFSWMDVTIELTINHNGKITVLNSIYNPDTDEDSWVTIKGDKGKMKKMTKYNMKRNVYVIPMETNTKDLSFTMKAVSVE